MSVLFAAERKVALHRVWEMPRMFSSPQFGSIVL